ncbi:MAG: hypothetical protein RLZ98_2081 [Pseudomonadota bacterium]|jgi:2-desacetyl-2-hydroxyethyl bacteriochlorophyllide A dehydrogenase
MEYTTTRAIWYVAAGEMELRSEDLKSPGSGEVLIETLYSGVSRGTERLVLSGAVPQAEWHRMRAPFQQGDFPFPVKYGYSTTGRVLAGPDELRGREVFVLHPHQEALVVPADAAVPIPAGIPARRATLAANMETALNAIWDSGAGPGDRIIVVGAGVVGLLTAHIAAGLPGAHVTVVDPAPERETTVRALGAEWAAELPEAGIADVVFHASATPAGLDTALSAAGFEATVVEMSWYGERRIEVGLGGAFHSQRLKLICSQVGSVSRTRRSRWNHRRRLEAALKLLHEPALDLLVGEEIAFETAPQRLPQMLAPAAAGLAPVIAYAKTR